MNIRCAQIDRTSLATTNSTTRTLFFAPVSLNCGYWTQMLLRTILEARLVLHMPLVIEIISATPRPSSCTPLIPQPNPPPLLHGASCVSRPHTRTAGINGWKGLTRDTPRRSGKLTASVLSTT